MVEWMVGRSPRVLCLDSPLRRPFLGGSVLPPGSVVRKGPAVSSENQFLLPKEEDMVILERAFGTDSCLAES